MTLGDLSVLYIYFLYGLIFLLAMGGFSLGQRSKLILKTRSYEAMAYGIFLLSLVLLTVLTEILNRNKVSYLRLKDLSIFPFLGLVFLVLVFDGVLFRKLKASSKEDFTDLSIKECLDTLPVGVAFSDCQGRPYLVNYKIDELSRLVFGRNLVNSLDFFDEAMVQNFMEGAQLLRRNSKDNILISARGVWQLENIYHGQVMETLAKDVTEEYELVHETEEKNKKIASLNQQLKAYSQTIDSFIREKELLAAKRKIHDDMGRTLILLRLYMENEDKKAEDRKELLNLWRQNLVLLKGGIKNPDKGSSWDKLIGAARGAGIDLDLKGSLPSEKKTLGLLTEILHEAINNAILHGQAKTLFLDIVEDKMTYTFTIRNDGLRPLGPLVEKGGLKNIRRRVEMEGGSLYITGNPDFLMQIVLRKEVSHDI